MCHVPSDDLTTRELEVIHRLVDRLGNQEIAERRGLSPRTGAGPHRQRDEPDAELLTHAAGVFALQHGLVQLGAPKRRCVAGD